MATPIHNHTYFSAYDGLSKPKQIADRVVELGYGACGCTDHGVVAGHIEFYKAMETAGVKPLLGIETYQAPISRHEHAKGLKDSVSQMKVENFHLILLAMNPIGLRNLWAMNTESHETGFFHQGRVDWELLEKYNEGIVATSACFLGMIQQSLGGNVHLEDADTILQRYLNIFGDRFYLELSTYPTTDQRNINIDTVMLADQYGVPLVYGNDAHYATSDQYDLHEAIMALQQNKKLKDPVQDLANPKGRPHHEPALYIMGEEEVRQHLNYLPASRINEALANTDTIAELCNVTLPKYRQRLPLFVPDKPYKTGREQLFDLVEKGFKEKVKENHEEYFERVESELGVIFSANLVDYLLLVRDYVEHASNQGILVGPGRGSVGGSLVAYLLGITQVDPIRFGLIFERFYNAGRETSLPDIDIDFPQRSREGIKQFLMKKYGKDHVADIGTVIRLGPKSAINDMARVQSVPLKPDVTAITSIIDKAFDAGLQPDWETILTDYGQELEPYMAKYPLVFEWAQKLAETTKDSKDDHVKTYGTHASGVLIADEPLRTEFPLRWVPSEQKMVSQWDMRDAEKLGFQKVDILGLTKLDTLDEVNRILVEQGKEPIDYSSLIDQEFPDEMWNLLDKGATVGIFQVEDGGMAKQVIKSMKVRSIEDAAIGIAINRPGTLRSGGFERYMNGRKGGTNSVHHPLIAKVCSETYGVLIFQEQVIEFFTEIGYTLQEADEIRSIMGKKKVDVLNAEYPRYMKNALNFMNETQAQAIWEDLVGFAKYGFNKSHAVEYAIILLWCLYAKWKHPREFLVAAIRTVDKAKRSRYVQEAQRMKIPVHAPAFFFSQAETSLIGENDIQLGYSDINGIGLAAAIWLEEHTFSGLERKTFEEFIASDEGKIVLNNGSKRKALSSAHLDAMDKLNMFYPPREESLLERMEIEEEMLKVAVSDESTKVLNEYQDMIEENCVPFAFVDEPGEYTVAGVIRDITKHKTQAGKDYAKVLVVDDTGDELTLFVWNNNLKRLSFIFRNRTAGVFQIVKKNRDGATLQDAVILHPKSLTVKTPYANLIGKTTE